MDTIYEMCILQHAYIDGIPTLIHVQKATTLPNADINECEENPGICGVGSTCTNLPSRLFYDCNCKPGTITNGGDASQLQLTCSGKSTFLILSLCAPGMCNNSDDGGFIPVCGGGL